MRTKLTRVGNDIALILDEAILEQLGLDANSEVEVSVEAGVVIIEPIRDDARRRTLKEAMDGIDEQYGNVFRRLAE